MFKSYTNLEDLLNEVELAQELVTLGFPLNRRDKVSPELIKNCDKLDAWSDIIENKKKFKSTHCINNYKTRMIEKPNEILKVLNKISKNNKTEIIVMLDEFFLIEYSEFRLDKSIDFRRVTDEMTRDAEQYKRLLKELFETSLGANVRLFIPDSCKDKNWYKSALEGFKNEFI